MKLLSNSDSFLKTSSLFILVTFPPPSTFESQLTLKFLYQDDSFISIRVYIVLPFDPDKVEGTLVWTRSLLSLVSNEEGDQWTKLFINS